MISKADSERLDCLRFPLIIGVLYIHAYGIRSATQDTPTLNLIRELGSQEFARTAVPIFFLISGFLFFNGNALTPRTYLQKLLNRTHSLLIPLIIWNTLTIIFFAFAQSLPFLQTFFSGQNAPIKNYGWLDFIVAIFGIGRHPISYQFWFIRDLMVLVILSPALEYFLRKVPWLLLIPMTFFWFIDIGFNWVPSPEALLFFSAGALISLRNESLFPPDHIGKVAVITYPFLAFISALKLTTATEGIFHHATVAIGVLALLYTSKFISNWPIFEKSLLRLSGASFFVFAAHEPLLTLLRKLGVRLLQDHGEAALIGLYALLPLALSGVLVAIHKKISVIAPTTLSIIAGKVVERGAGNWHTNKGTHSPH